MAGTQEAIDEMSAPSIDVTLYSLSLHKVNTNGRRGKTKERVVNF